MRARGAAHQWSVQRTARTAAVIQVSGMRRMAPKSL
jgi:hypothetical protein